MASLQVVGEGAMRVRVNFTIDVDLDDYRETMEVDMTKDEIRKTIQERAITDTVLNLTDEGVGCRLLGRNNAYDSEQRLTRSEQLVGKP
jgi:hypothetical protein